MKIAVLLSAGRHPVSGKPAPVTTELQAIRLAASIGAEVTGLHAGPDAAALVDTLGYGLPRLTHYHLDAGDDPTASLVAALRAGAYDLVLAGRMGQGGEDSGLLPYALARALNLPIVADASALSEGPQPGTLKVEQALPRGARRRLVIRLPALVTVHPAAPAPAPFAYAAMRRGGIEVRPGIASPREESPLEERAYRPRPKMIAKAAAGASAAERLKAATQSASGGGRLLVDPTPEDAAREILAHLRKIGVLRR